jgi:fibrillarin-like rRNA methylase
MIVYNKEGKDYLLLANSSRGVMKIKTEGVDSAESISSPVTDTKGQAYETIAGLKGVVQLDTLDKDHAVVLIQANDGSMNIESIDLP